MYDKEKIINNAIYYQKKRGIYFLIKWDHIVYIWQTQNIDERMQTHIKNKDFDRYYFEEIKDINIDLDILENKLIIQHKPKLNKYIVKPLWYMSKQEIFKKYKLWKKWLDKNSEKIHKFEFLNLRYFNEKNILSLI